jgi:integrase
VLPGTDGKVRKRKTVEVETRDDALLRWKRFKDQVLAGQIETTDQTFADYAARHLEDYVRRVRPSTAKSYAYFVRNHLLPFFSETRLSGINMSVIREFHGHLKTKRLSASTINDALAVLRLLVRDAYDRGLLQALPYRGRFPHEKTTLPRLELSPEELTRFLSAFEDEDLFRRHFATTRALGRIGESSRFHGPRRFGGGLRPDGRALGYYFERFRSLKPFFVIALETGLRKKDLLSLRWSCVDLEGGWIRVTTRKTGQEVQIPLSTRCRESLLSCRALGVISEVVFTNDEGTPLSWTSVQSYFNLAKSLGGITRRFRFHDLRHTFGCRLASAGVSLQVIAKAMGHASIRMTERYARPSEEAMQAVRRALDGLSNAQVSGQVAGRQSGDGY